MTKKLSAVLLFWAISAMAQQLPIEIDPALDQSKINFQLWNTVVRPVHDRLTIPLNGTLKIIAVEKAVFKAGAGEIYIGKQIFPDKKDDPNNWFYVALTHEYSHAKFLVKDQPSSSNIGSLQIGSLLIEGFAEAEKALTYRELHRSSPNIRPLTYLWWGQALDNMSLNSIGGGEGYGYNLTVYESIASKLELYANLLPGKNFNRFYQERERFWPATDEQFISMLDRIAEGKKIDGVLPLTFFLQSPAAFTGGPDGVFVGVSVINASPPNENWEDAMGPINPSAFTVYVMTRKNGKPVYDTSILAKPLTISGQWRIGDAYGKAMASGTSSHVESKSLTLKFTSNFDFTQRTYQEIRNIWPEGGYRLVFTGCASFSNACEYNFNEVNHFVVYRKPWDKGKLFVIANGPRFEDLSAQTQLRLVNPPAGVTTETYPGLLVVNLNGATQDITVTDGKRTRIFTPDWELSRFVFFTDRDQPYLKNVINAATFKEGLVVPGSIATLFTWGATQGDPEVSTSNPLPTTSCGGRTRVMFTTADGKDLPAPISYCSQLQLNVQVPIELRGQERAWVRIQLGDSFSNQVEVQVADADPGIFMIDPDRKIGAVIFANGPKAGQLVTPENPAHPGDYLSVFATGLGETIPSMPGDGMAAPLPPPLTEQTAAVFMLYTTLRPVMASANDAPWPVVFSGLVPGFVGLYQVNIQVPPDTAPGIYSFTIAVEGSEKRVVSNEILITVRN